MEVIGHDHKFMQQKSPFPTILRKHINQKLSHAIGLQKRAASVCRRAHEERTRCLRHHPTRAKARSLEDKALPRV